MNQGNFLKRKNIFGVGSISLKVNSKSFEIGSYKKLF